MNKFKVCLSVKEKLRWSECSDVNRWDPSGNEDLRIIMLFSISGGCVRAIKPSETSYWWPWNHWESIWFCSLCPFTDKKAAVLLFHFGIELGKYIYIAHWLDFQSLNTSYYSETEYWEVSNRHKGFAGAQCCSCESNSTWRLVNIMVWGLVKCFPLHPGIPHTVDLSHSRFYTSPAPHTPHPSLAHACLIPSWCKEDKVWPLVWIEMLLWNYKSAQMNAQAEKITKNTKKQTFYRCRRCNFHNNLVIPVQTHNIESIQYAIQQSDILWEAPSLCRAGHISSPIHTIKLFLSDGGSIVRTAHCKKTTFGGLASQTIS